MKVFLQLVSILVVNLFEMYRAEYRCYNYHCGSFNESICARAEPFVDTKNITLKQCEDGTYCNMDNFPDKEESVGCQKIPEPVNNGYAGDPCSKDIDCYSSICSKEKTCQGFSEGQKCVSHFECDLGLSCSNKTTSNSTQFVCTPQGKEGEFCNHDFDCENNLGCMKDFYNCTRYFSLPDGYLLDTKYDSHPTFCKSGYYDQSNRMCSGYESDGDVHKPCTDACNYIRHDGKNITLAGSCKCSFSEEGRNYCQAGPYDYVWKNKTSLLQSMLDLEVSSKKCYSFERTKCNYIKKTYPHLFQEYTNLEVLALEGPRLINAPQCVKTMMFPHYKEIVIDKCSKIACDESITKKDIDICAKRVKSIKDGSQTLTYGKPCKDGQYCDILDGEYGNKTEIAYKCKNFQKRSAFPGEKCRDHSDCLNNFDCFNGVCRGSDAGDLCTTHFECVAGNFCNSTQRCQPQRTLGQSCLSDLDCLNSMVCVSEKCVLFGSLSNGVNASSPFACKSGYTNSKNECDTFVYDMPNKRPEANGFYACKPDQNGECLYKFERTGETLQFTCDCGLSSNGKSYCPKDMKDPKPFYQLSEQQRKRLDSHCHTLNRGSCNELGYKPSDDFISSVLNSVAANKYVDAPACVYPLPAVDYGIGVLVGIVLLISFLIFIRFLK